jgi:hypothetical protein
MTGAGGSSLALGQDHRRLSVIHDSTPMWDEMWHSRPGIDEVDSFNTFSNAVTACAASTGQRRGGGEKESARDSQARRRTLSLGFEF